MKSPFFRAEFSQATSGQTQESTVEPLPLPLIIRIEPHIGNLLTSPMQMDSMRNVN